MLWPSQWQRPRPFLPEPSGSYERLYASIGLNTCSQLPFQNSWQIPLAGFPPPSSILLLGLWRDMDRALGVILDHACPGNSSGGTARSRAPGACAAAFSAQNCLHPHLLCKEKGNIYLVYFCKPLLFGASLSFTYT